MKNILLAFLAGMIIAYLNGLYQHHLGYQDGQTALLSEQAKEQAERLAAQQRQQQKDDAKAAAADEIGKKEAEVITRDIIKYVKTPGRNVCVYDPVRVSIKASSVQNANCLAGFDDCPMQAGGTVK